MQTLSLEKRAVPRKLGGVILGLAFADEPTYTAILDPGAELHHPSQLSGVRNVVDVVCSFRHRESDVVEKEFARVDVSEEFPFLVSKLAPYFDR